MRRDAPDRLRFDGKNLLFVHNNFPAQLGFVASSAANAGARCAAIGSPSSRPVPGVDDLFHWEMERGTTKNIFPLAVRAEADLLRGRAAADCALELKEEGFVPDAIVAHPGWGETLFLREIFPAAKQILYAEYFYHCQGIDVGFDPEFPVPSLDEQFRVRAKNATMSMGLTDADHIVCPTRFQQELLPQAFQPQTTLIHEGVDVEATQRIPGAKVALPNKVVLDASRPVITFVNRHLEPLRGFHIFMRALPAVLRAVPDAQVLIIGDDQKGYGLAPPEGTTWKAQIIEELQDQVDLGRVHFLGRIARAELIAALSISRAHVYYTYPFVLSWSLLDAMACECAIIASDTRPLHDVIEDRRNGILLDFFDVEALSQTLIRCCREPGQFEAMRKAARSTITQRFDRKRHSIPAWLTLLHTALQSS